MLGENLETGYCRYSLRDEACKRRNYNLPCTSATYKPNFWIEAPVNVKQVSSLVSFGDCNLRSFKILLVMIIAWCCDEKKRKLIDAFHNVEMLVSGHCSVFSLKCHLKVKTEKINIVA